jgi:hypothetical protein
MLRIISSQKNKAILVHGWDGGVDKNWFPWLNKELIDIGYSVQPLSMPDPASPQRRSWVKHLQDHVIVNKKTILIAHSIGCIAVIRYLETIPEIPKAIILVAPFVNNEHDYKTVRSFFHGPIDWAKIRKCKNIHTIYSDDDPFVSIWQKSVFEDEANATTRLVCGSGHFDGDKLPIIMDIVREIK